MTRKAVGFSRASWLSLSAGQLERRIEAQPIEVVAIGIAAANRQHAGARRFDEDQHLPFACTLLFSRSFVCGMTSVPRVEVVVLASNLESRRTHGCILLAWGQRGGTEGRRRGDHPGKNFLVGGVQPSHLTPQLRVEGAEFCCHNASMSACAASLRGSEPT